MNTEDEESKRAVLIRNLNKLAESNIVLVEIRSELAPWAKDLSPKIAVQYLGTGCEQVGIFVGKRQIRIPARSLLTDYSPRRPAPLPQLSTRKK